MLFKFLYLNDLTKGNRPQKTRFCGQIVDSRAPGGAREQNGQKMIRNIFLLENLSERRPNIGAISINIILAIEFDTPRYSVRSESIIEEAKYSA